MSKKAIAKKQEGNAYYKKQEYAKAKKSYLQAIQIDPTYIQGYSNLAMVLHMTASYDQSLQICNKVLEIEPGNKKALYRKALNYSKQNNKNIETIHNARLYLQKQAQEAIPNQDAIQSIKIVIKQAKQRFSALAQSSEMVELSCLKMPSLTSLPPNMKDISILLLKQDKKLTLEKCRQLLKEIVQQLSKNYNSETLMELDKIKRLAFKKLIDLESTSEQKLNLINILLNTSNSKQQKERLLWKKFELETIPDSVKLETLKSLYELTKNSKLQQEISELQSRIRKQYESESNKQQQKQDYGEQKHLNGHKVEQPASQRKKSKHGEKVLSQIEKKPSQQQQLIKSKIVQIPKTQKVTAQTIMEKLKHCEKHKKMEQFFGLFKLIGEQQIPLEKKIEYLKLLLKSSICHLFVSGAIKGEKHYIKKLFKELGQQSLYQEFKFK